jgi:hypothetical protein
LPVNLKTVHTSLLATATLLSVSASFAQEPSPAADGTAGTTAPATAAPAGDAPASAPPALAPPASAPPASEPPPPGAQPYAQQYTPPPPPEPESQDMAPNGIYAELLGPGGIYSINYERVIANVVAPRVGFSYLGGSSAGQSWSLVSIPITVSFVGLHSGAHGFEVGAGGAIYIASGAASVGGTSTSSSGTAGLLTALAGYRLHPIGHMGFQFRVGFEINGVFSNGATAVYPWPYLSVGAAF